MHNQTQQHRDGPKMTSRLAGKTAIITGAGSGFGEGMARRFAEEGARIVCVDINAKAANHVAKTISAGGGKAIAVTADVGRRDDTERMVAAAMSAYGRIDIMVNNAGFSHRNGPLSGVGEDTFDQITDVNMKSIYHSTLACLPHFEAQGSGVILNTASTAGLRPRPGLTWYNASKGWVITATKSQPSWAKTRPKSARSSNRSSRLGGFRRPKTSPMPLCSWSLTKLRSSPASLWKWTAAGAFE
jgi:NAD(P)-dependent dehydrogenase (short-subunit alcohol dehydrogenase family)